MKLRFLTAGESHGRALLGILEGVPAGINICEQKLSKHMLARKTGYGRGSRQKIETDRVEVLSGVRFGKTLGTPISLMIENKDFENWKEVMPAFGESRGLKEVKVPRPGHSDAVGGIKFQYSDLRDALERASARETAMRVAIGFFAKTFLEAVEIQINSRVTKIGNIVDHTEIADYRELSSLVEQSPVRCCNLKISDQMIELIDQARQDKDTLGGEFEVYGINLPIGIGSYTHWDRKIEAKIGESFLSLNAIKSVEIGLGKKSAELFGSEVHDEMLWDQGLKFKTNKTGGVLAGVSNGSPLVVRASMKPISTLMKPLDSFHWDSKDLEKAHIERSDYCAVPAASVIGESLMAISLAELVLEKFGGDSLIEIQPRVEQWREKTRS